MSESAKVLVVCEGDVERRRLGAAVRAAGYPSLTAASTAEAVRSLGKSSPLALVVTCASDASFAAYSELRESSSFAATPVLVCGTRSAAELQRAFALDADDVVDDPTDVRQLRVKLCALHAASDTKLEPKKSGGRSKTVLVADDDRFFRVRLGDMLEEAGYQVRFATSGVEVMEAVDARAEPRPDLCVIDIFMPGLGGLEVVRALRRTPGWSDIPILVVSGVRRDRALMEELQRMGVQDFVDKAKVTIDGVVPLVGEYLSEPTSKRRGAPRVSCCALAEFRRSKEEGWLSGLVYNIGPSGMFIRSLAVPAPDSMVDLRLDLGSGAPLILARARVAWAAGFRRDPRRTPCGMGLNFAELSQEGLRHIDALVAGEVSGIG